jgi:hypothetical protein
MARRSQWLEKETAEKETAEKETAEKETDPWAQWDANRRYTTQQSITSVVQDIVNVVVSDAADEDYNVAVEAVTEALAASAVADAALKELKEAEEVAGRSSSELDALVLSWQVASEHVTESDTSGLHAGIQELMQARDERRHLNLQSMHQLKNLREKKRRRPQSQVALNRIPRQSDRRVRQRCNPIVGTY